jgi:hypothetical protein
MPNSYRIRTQLGAEQVLQVNLEQEFDSLDILSLSIYPNDIYTRNCADFGVVCGRVFCNRGFGLVNARVAIFIPIDEVDELNPLISTLYPYKSFEDFNEDGYKFNLLPYTQSHSGHVPVGTFPDRIDALVWALTDLNEGSSAMISLSAMAVFCPSCRMPAPKSAGICPKCGTSLGDTHGSA